MRRIILALTLLVLCARPSAASEWDRLTSATTLRCTAGPGATADWDGNKPELEVSRWSKGNTFHLDQIDIASGTAHLIGNVGAENVKVVATLTGLHFFEFAASGNLIVRTVFAKAVEGAFPYVESRHVDLGPNIADLLPSQWHGTCERLE